MSIINIEFLAIDYFVIIFSVIIIIFSLWKGFINSTLSLLTWIGSLFVTIYTYEYISAILNDLLLDINLLENYQQFVYILSILISIPVIFLICLFIFKRIRKVLSSDLDKNWAGLLLDKFFGAIYGIIFTYLIYSTILYLTNNTDFQILKNINIFLVENSNVLGEISKYNENLIKLYFINTEL